MATCKKCGTAFGNELKTCPQCGEKRKKSKAPVVIIIVLVVLLVAGGAYTYWWYRQNHPQYNTFDCNCAAFTERLNRELDKEDRSEWRLAADYWALKGDNPVPTYEGSGFTMTAKTGDDNSLEADIRELRVGPVKAGDNKLLAALSVLALEEYHTMDAILADMQAVMEQQKDKASYNVVEFSYDCSSDELVLTPSTGAETPEGTAATADQARFTSSVFVYGNGFIKAGGKYIFTNGNAIRCRDNITDNNTVIIDDANDGQLLSDGETLFYVNDDGSSRRVCMIDIDGEHPLTLMNLAEKVTLINACNNCLYYVTESAENAGNYAFCRYRFDLKEAEKFNDIRFAPNRALVSGNLLYCTALPKTTATSDSALQGNDPQGDVYTFNFDTEEFVKVLSDCRVSAHGFFNGAGNPCFDSYQTDDQSGALLNHSLYTADNGVLKKSSEITVNALLWFASPATHKAVLCDNPNQLYYWFDRATGEVQEMEVPTQGAFAFDIEHPEKLYLCVSDEGKLNRLYEIIDGKLIERGFGDTPVPVAPNPVIANGYLLDTNHDAYPITNEPVPLTTAAPAETLVTDAALPGETAETEAAQ